MSKHFWLLSFFLTLLASSFSFADEVPNCPPPPPGPELSTEAVQAGLKNARDHGFLWRISKDGRTSWLYGTLHVAKAEWVYPGPTLIQALKETDTVALEMDMLDPAIQARMAKLMTTGKTVALPAATVARIRRQAASACVPYEAIEKLSPELQVVVLAVMAARRDGLETAYAIDGMLAGFGHRANRRMVSLESPEFQMKTLNLGGGKETRALVDASLDELESGKAMASLGRLVQAWVESDYAAMETYPAWCECMGTAVERKLMKRVLDERNPGLADRIDRLHGEGRQVFAAVGSLHMFGAAGLPALMQKRGYQVERITLGSPQVTGAARSKD